MHDATDGVPTPPVFRPAVPARVAAANETSPGHHSIQSDGGGEPLPVPMDASSSTAASVRPAGFADLYTGAKLLETPPSPGRSDAPVVLLAVPVVLDDSPEQSERGSDHHDILHICKPFQARLFLRSVLALVSSDPVCPPFTVSSTVVATSAVGTASPIFSADASTPPVPRWDGCLLGSDVLGIDVPAIAVPIPASMLKLLPLSMLSRKGRIHPIADQYPLRIAMAEVRDALLCTAPQHGPV